MFKFENGAQVRDRITGFRGVVIGQTHWFSGCKQYAVSATTLHEGKPIDSMWFDEDRLELTTASAEAEKPVRGGPHPNPKAAHVR